MADPAKNLPEQVQAIEQKLDGLATSVDARFNAVDVRFDALSTSVEVRFDEVSAAIAEQRQCTEFAFDSLGNEMKAGFRRVERKLDQFIDTQSRTNELVERRLRLLEPPPQ